MKPEDSPTFTMSVIKCRYAALYRSEKSRFREAVRWQWRHTVFFYCDPISAGVGRGLRLAERTARKAARMHGTPIYFWKNGKVVAEKP
jgi:hypothetical protein